MTPKQYLRQIPLIEEYLKKRRITMWIKEGYKPGLHYIKQITILYYAVTYQLDVLVETGTFLGDMIWAQKDYFKKIYSIEISRELFDKAVRRFRNKNHIQLLNGDSSDKLKIVTDQLTGPAIFWLDGHYSEGISTKGNKECPIIAELTCIFNSPFSHAILIDDARLFVGKNDYPSLDELKIFVNQNSRYSMKVENDIIILSK